ncbi:MAG: Thymidylate synthase ThyX [candidate division TM6 bacterium GW2011_GWF2_32_72]|nr:MAG: Thymidylate synthase ThyX [candidate division TM6 bacterium GW2011_GWF2_32_72]
MQIKFFEEKKFVDRLVLDPLGDGISSLELIRVSGSDLDIVNAARVSFGKMADEISPKDESLIKYLLEHDHTSPFEHNQFSFRVKAPIYVVRQWMRHRMASYNEISYRYVQAPLEFYVPSNWRWQDKDNKQSSFGAYKDSDVLDGYKKTLNFAAKIYLELIEKGVCREQARGVLPVCTYTEFIYSCNLHSLMHFLKLRLHPHAQYEIRVFAEGLLKLVLPHFPIALREWEKLNNINLRN